MLRASLIMVVFLLVTSCIVWGETMYSWVDQNGVKRFGDSPPPGAQQVKEMGAHRYNREKDMARHYGEKERAYGNRYEGGSGRDSGGNAQSSQQYSMQSKEDIYTAKLTEFERGEERELENLKRRKFTSRSAESSPVLAAKRVRDKYYDKISTLKQDYKNMSPGAFISLYGGKKNSTRNHSSTPASISRHSNGGGGVDSNGAYYAPAGPNMVNSQTGTVYVPAGDNGYINTQTGEFVPAN